MPGTDTKKVFPGNRKKNAFKSYEYFGENAKHIGREFGVRGGGDIMHILCFRKDSIEDVRGTTYFRSSDASVP